MPNFIAAEGGAPTNVEFLPFLTIIVVFLITLYILARFVWPIITRSLDERDQKIRDEIESAEEAREQAKATLAEYEQSLARAREEANQMVAKAKADAKAAAEELRQRNEAELNEMKQRAMREIQAAREAAVNEIYVEASSLATSIAAKILQREVTAEDQQRLVDESLQELAAARSN